MANAGGAARWLPNAAAVRHRCRGTPVEAGLLRCASRICPGCPMDLSRMFARFPEDFSWISGGISDALLSPRFLSRFSTTLRRRFRDFSWMNGQCPTMLRAWAPREGVLPSPLPRGSSRGRPAPGMHAYIYTLQDVRVYIHINIHNVYVCTYGWIHVGIHITHMGVYIHVCMSVICMYILICTHTHMHT